MQNPVENIEARPLDTKNNILEWHYVVHGPKGTPYEGGVYHGKLRFPKNYPFGPPSIYMITPSGRFQTNSKLCLSMSDFHPESWNPLWTVSSILKGLLSFMIEDTPTYGSIKTSVQHRRILAAASLSYNCQGRVFKKLFPHLVAAHEKRCAEDPDYLQRVVEAQRGRKSSSGGSIFGFETSCSEVLVIVIAIVIMAALLSLLYT